MKTGIPILSLLAVSSSLCLAELASPSEELIAPLSPGMAWKVEVLPEKFKTDPEKVGSALLAGPKEGKLVEENVVGEDFRQQKVPVEDGNFRIRLVKGPVVLLMDADGKKYSLDYSDDEMQESRIDANYLQEFSWVGSEWLVGRGMVDGVECDLYFKPRTQVPHTEAAPNDPDSVDFVQPQGSRFAAIGREDRFPRRLELEAPVGLGSLRRYTLLPPVSPLPTLPEQAAEIIREIEEKIEQQSRRYRIPQ